MTNTTTPSCNATVTIKVPLTIRRQQSGTMETATYFTATYSGLKRGEAGGGERPVYNRVPGENVGSHDHSGAMVQNYTISYESAR